MKNILARLSLAAILAVGFFGASSISSPAPTLAACSGSYVQIFSNSGQSGDNRMFCYPAYASNFASLSGPCQFLAANWDDCVSSIRIYIPMGSNLKACFYEYAYFVDSRKLATGTLDPLWLVRWDGELANMNDAVSSFKWITGSSCPTG